MTKTAFNRAYGTDLPQWNWLELPEQKADLRAFGIAMRGSASLQLHDALLECTCRKTSFFSLQIILRDFRRPDISGTHQSPKVYIVSSQQRLASDRPAAWIWEGKVSDKASGVIARTWPPRIGILRYTVLGARRVDQLTVKSAAAMSTQFAAAQSDGDKRVVESV